MKVNLKHRHFSAYIITGSGAVCDNTVIKIIIFGPCVYKMVYMLFVWLFMADVCHDERSISKLCNGRCQRMICCEFRGYGIRKRIQIFMVRINITHFLLSVCRFICINIHSEAVRNKISRIIGGNKESKLINSFIKSFYKAHSLNINNCIAVYRNAFIICTVHTLIINLSQIYSMHMIGGKAAVRILIYIFIGKV